MHSIIVHLLPGRALNLNNLLHPPHLPSGLITGLEQPPPRALKKAAERGRGPGSVRERKNWNVHRVVAPANVPIIRNYPILSDFFRKLTRAVHRRGIYSCTAIRTAFSPSCHSTTPAWMYYSGNSIWRLIYSSGLPQGESVLSIRAGEIQFDDD